MEALRKAFLRSDSEHSFVTPRMAKKKRMEVSKDNRRVPLFSRSSCFSFSPLFCFSTHHKSHGLYPFCFLNRAFETRKNLKRKMSSANGLTSFVVLCQCGIDLVFNRHVSQGRKFHHIIIISGGCINAIKKGQIQVSLAFSL